MRKLILAIILFSISFPAWSSTDVEESENKRDLGMQESGNGAPSETRQEPHQPSSPGSRPSIQVKLAPNITGKWLGICHQDGRPYDEQLELDVQQNGEAVTGSATERSKFLTYKTTVSGSYVAATGDFILKDLRFEYKHSKLLLLMPILVDCYDLHSTDNDSHLVGTFVALGGYLRGVIDARRAVELSGTPSESAEK